MAQDGDVRSTNPKDGRERRIAPRHRVEIEVSFESDHNFFMGFTENLSEGGLFVATHQLKPIGTVIDLQFKIPGRDEPIEVKGEVRWVRPYSERNKDVAPGMGVRFTDVSAECVQIITDFLKARAPIFYDD